MAVLTASDYAGLTEEAWSQMGVQLRERRTRQDHQGSELMWSVGDWVLQGEDNVLKQRKRAHVRELAAEITGYSKHTLAMAVSVSRKVDPAIRVGGLTWWHHLAVARLDPALQAVWLTRAAEDEWTVAQLRQELSAANALLRRRRRRPAAQKLVRDLLDLSRNEIPEPLAADLFRWLRGEFGPEQAQTMPSRASRPREIG